MPPREIAARAIYALRPFRIAQSVGVLEMMSPVREFDWDAAPDFYQQECFELADGVLNALQLAGVALERAE